jgi:hypothetical protein
LIASLTVVELQYAPEGFTPESYKKFKEDEKKRTATKNLGKLGPRGFQSRRYENLANERVELADLISHFLLT